MNSQLTVGFTHNTKRTEADYKEWDSSETIQNITEAMESSGIRVVGIEADMNAFEEIKKVCSELDIVLNIAEGYQGNPSREATIPMMLELLGIPYIGSGPKTLLNGLDKPMTKQIVRYAGVPTPDFHTFDPQTYLIELEHLTATGKIRGNGKVTYPLMVKPSLEGTGVGITQKSKVYTPEELHDQIKRIVESLDQPALVESFLNGTEYTAGFVGPYILPIMEIDSQKIGKDIRCEEVKARDEDDTQYPAEIDDTYTTIVNQLTKVNSAMDCLDFGRSDFRAMKNGDVYFIEINPLPGLSLASDLVVCAKYAGISHTELVNMIIYEGLVRNVKKTPELQSKIHQLTEYLFGLHKRLEHQTHATTQVGGTSYKTIRPLSYKTQETLRV